MIQKISKKVRKDLKKKVDKKYRHGLINFFTEEIRPYGVRTGEARKIAAKYFKEIKSGNKEKIWKVCEELWQSGWYEEGLVAIVWASKMKDKYEKKEMGMFERWLKKYVKNWAHCDVFCTSSVGHLIMVYPEYLKKLDGWTRSKNRWLRRAAAVSLIYPVKKSDKKIFLAKVFEVADKLLEDNDDLVRKGYGWMLKEASNIYPKKVFDYVMKRKDKMPRVALRYAIEKMPKDWKKKAMKK